MLRERYKLAAHSGVLQIGAQTWGQGLSSAVWSRPTPKDRTKRQLLTIGSYGGFHTQWTQAVSSRAQNQFRLGARKRLSGAEYKKKVKMKKEEQEQVIRKTIKIDSILKVEVEVEVVLKDQELQQHALIQYNLEKVAQQQQSPVEQPAFEKTYIYVFDEEAVEESSISARIEDASQNQTLSNDQVQTSETTVNLNKDPALWENNDTLREIIARYGFGQNKSCDFSKSEKLYADQRRFLPVDIKIMAGKVDKFNTNPDEHSVELDLRRGGDSDATTIAVFSTKSRVSLAAVSLTNGDRHKI
uniref:Uncharacterized protein n=1 Tax=Timema cristinae TaxID=61476 RepID=A0A7R9CPY0_TIMCR|nr:unnamed protein product [Timema cristinae]